MPNRCADSTAAANLDPVGTAPGYRGYLLIEWPLPWPRKIESVEALAPVFARADALGVRVQFLHQPGADLAQCRIIRYARDDGAFRSFRRRALTVDRAEVVDAAMAALDDDSSAVDDGHRDVLVCTHGTRDACCGSRGPAVFAAVREPSSAGITVWRSSHLGGHRFAPTTLTLPDGHYWARLDPSLATSLVERAVDASDLRPHYRGCTVSDPFVQVVERAAFTDEGWTWLSSSRTSGTKGDVAWIEATRPDGSSVRYQGRVTVGREVTIPGCGTSDGAVEECVELSLSELTVTDERGAA